MGGTMNKERLLRTMANELPAILRQIQSPDPLLRAAGAQRLADFVVMTEPWRGPVQRAGGHRGRRGPVTFAAMSLKRDD